MRSRLSRRPKPASRRRLRRRQSCSAPLLRRKPCQLTRAGAIIEWMRFVVAAVLLAPYVLLAQFPGRGPASEGVQLDLEGKRVQARAVFQKAIETATSAAAKANAQRAMAMSWAFEGNCRKTGEYEQMVI